MTNYIIYLCGGNSKRFKENKLLYEFKGKPLYRHTYEKLKRIVSTHTNYSLLLVSQYKEIIENVDCETIFDKDCSLGASYSIKACLSHVKKPCFLTFVVADQPHLEESTLIHFMESTMHSNYKLSCVSYRQEMYNPCMFHSDYIHELQQLEEDQGGKRILRKHKEDVFLFEISNLQELIDIDTKDEL